MKSNDFNFSTRNATFTQSKIYENITKKAKEGLQECHGVALSLVRGKL